MRSSIYRITANLRIMRHYSLRALTVNDHALLKNPELDAHVRSGDYFITLATTLETVAEGVAEASASSVSLTLVRLAKDLDYIQRHYKIVKKDRPDRLTELH